MPMRGIKPYDKKSVVQKNAHTNRKLNKKYLENQDKLKKEKETKEK